MKRFGVLAILVVLALSPFSLLAGTVATTWSALKKGEQPQVDGVVSIEQAVVADTTVSFVLSDGTTISLEKYEALIKAGKLRFPDAFEIVVSGDAAQEVPAAGDGKPIQLWGLIIVFVPLHTHSIAGCINRVVPHVGLQIKEAQMVRGIKAGERLLFDLHLAKWNDGGKACVGIYITKEDPARPGRTVRVFCWKGCMGFDFMNPNQLKDKLVQGFVTVGIPLAFAVPLMFIAFPLLLAL